MYFQVQFAQPYDNTETPWRIAIVVGVDNDRDAAKAFRQRYPNAERVTAKCMRGEYIVVDNTGLYADRPALVAAASESTDRLPTETKRQWYRRTDKIYGARRLLQRAKLIGGEKPSKVLCL